MDLTPRNRGMGTKRAIFSFKKEKKEFRSLKVACYFCTEIVTVIVI